MMRQQRITIGMINGNDPLRSLAKPRNVVFDTRRMTRIIRRQQNIANALNFTSIA